MANRDERTRRVTRVSYRATAPPPYAFPATAGPKERARSLRNHSWVWLPSQSARRWMRAVGPTRRSAGRVRTPARQPPPPFDARGPTHRAIWEQQWQGGRRLSGSGSSAYSVETIAAPRDHPQVDLELDDAALEHGDSSSPCRVLVEWPLVLLCEVSRSWPPTPKTTNPQLAMVELVLGWCGDDDKHARWRRLCPVPSEPPTSADGIAER